MRKLTEAAQVAQQIRSLLKKAFPTTHFTVRSQNYAGGDDVNVDWVDGPTRSAVEKLTAQYEAGSFDGMTDTYNYNPAKYGKLTTKYLFCNRRFSEAVREQERAQVKREYGMTDGDVEDKEPFHERTGFWMMGDLIYNRLQDRDLQGVSHE